MSKQEKRNKYLNFVQFRIRRTNKKCTDADVTSSSIYMSMVSGLFIIEQKHKSANVSFINKKNILKKHKFTTEP